MNYKVLMTRVSHRETIMDIISDNEGSVLNDAETKACDVDFQAEGKETHAHYEGEIIGRSSGKDFEEFFEELSKCSAVFINGALSEVEEYGSDDEEGGLEISLLKGDLTLLKNEIEDITKEGLLYKVKMPLGRDYSFQLLYFKGDSE
jgi:hypothetical protein